jgi:peptidoglycan pentaglycine glycine transferase (the first glycine)
MKVLRQCRDKQEWNDYVLDHGGHPLQLWGWGELKSLHGWDAVRLQLVDDESGEVFGGAQIIVRDLPIPFKCLSYIPRGPIVDEANRLELLSLLAVYAKETFGSIALTIEPDEIEYSVPEDWIVSNNSILPSKTVILDLKKTQADLLADMSKKTRQYIRKSSAENIEFKSVKNREELKHCLEIYHETNKRAKFNIHSDQYYYDVYNRLEDNSRVFAAYHEDKPVAFLWLAISIDTAYELYGGVTEVGQDLRVNYALKWYAILKCKEWGIKKYDFGGLIEGGVSTFKMGWASTDTDLAGTYDKPLSVLYKVWKKVLPKAKRLNQKIKSKAK